MKTIFVLLTVCLFITLSVKRARKFYRFIGDKFEIQTHITEEDNPGHRCIRKHPGLLINSYNLSNLTEDDSAAARERFSFTGISGRFSIFFFRKYVKGITKKYFSDAAIYEPSSLYNKGSPKDKNIRQPVSSISLKNNHSLFLFLYLPYSSFTINKDDLFLLDNMLSAIPQFERLRLSGIRRLPISEWHSIPALPPTFICCILIFGNILFPP